MYVSRYSPDDRHAVLQLAGLRSTLGEPSVTVAVESQPQVLRYLWPCGCSAFGVGGPKCVARCCSGHKLVC